MLSESKEPLKQRVGVVIGTRPEAIKMAPIIHALRAKPEEFETVVISTGQHRQMLDQVLTIFGIQPDTELALMADNQSLVDLTGKLLSGLEQALRALAPDILLVQGDTTTTFAAALVAFHLRIAVGHVEAGLRSHKRFDPFPEEINRRLTTTLTDIHFAPTSTARTELCREGVPPQCAVVTGNTVVDALRALLDVPFELATSPLASIPFERHRVLLVTSHRRESWGHSLECICLALKELVARFDDLLVVYPVHLNPNVRKTVLEVLDGAERVMLLEPLDYLTFINLMRRSHLILTDSGGIQEEAPTLGKPLLVLRELTERPEAFQAGLARIIGTSQAAVVSETANLLTDPKSYRAMTSRHNPFGDGRAAARIVRALQRRAGGMRPLLNPEDEFIAAVAPAAVKEVA